MSYSTSDANKAWKLTPEQEQKILTLTSVDEISSYVRQCGLDNGVVQQLDGAAPGTLVDVPAEFQRSAEVAPKFKIKVAGQEFTANSLEELERQYTPALQAAMAANAAARQDEQTRGSDGRFTKQPSISDGADRITNSLVAKALKEDLGVEPEDLQAAVQEIRSNRTFESNWSAASQEFMKRNPEYSGNDETVKAIGERLIAMGLDEQPSAENLQKAYDSLAEEAQRYLALKDAKTPEEITAILGIDDRRLARQTSAQWGK
jgi:hypothetical protein